jgi:hypothetical protein
VKLRNVCIAALALALVVPLVSLGARAVVAAALGLVNVGLYAAGFEIDGERPQIVGVNLCQQRVWEDRTELRLPTLHDTCASRRLGIIAQAHNDLETRTIATGDGLAECRIDCRT